MLPLLRFASDKKNHSSLEAVEKMSEVFRLSEEQKTRIYPSGKNVPIFYDRVPWARADLVNAGLLRQVERGIFEITERGLSVLSEKPDRIDRKFLERFPEFEEYLSRQQTWLYR